MDISIMTLIELYKNECKSFFSYQVAWIHFDRSAILTVQNNVITRNPRIGVSHEGHRTWNLHIKNVQRTDQGAYMCQINTSKAKTRLGYLNVVGKCFEKCFHSK